MIDDGPLAGGQASAQAGGPAPAPAIPQSVAVVEPGETYNLRLYVAGQTPKSLTAIVNLQRICGEYLAGRHVIDIIDLLKSPQLAASDQIVAVPTLVRHTPPPPKRIIGTLSNTERVLIGLDLRSNQDNRP